MTKRLFLLLLLFWVFSVGICSAETIQTDELMKLDQIFSQLQMNLDKQDKMLLTANDNLQKSDQQITKLNEQLTMASKSISQAQTSLEKVSKSFDKYEKETQAEINKLRLQNILFTVVALYIGHSIK